MVGNAQNQYARLGSAVMAGRLAAGMAKQADLASAMKVSQQTISRWEAGIARPSEKQLLALATVLKLNVADMRRLIEGEETPPLSFVEPFPVDRLHPDTFESFVADLVQEENPTAEVRRAGGTGHTQDGLDVEAVLPDGRRLGLQCKRVQRFGPAEAQAAISAFPDAGYEKILVLSRVVSPQTAKAMRAAGWKVWDKDDLSRRVRRLPMAIQERLVDVYFRGQRLALLGRSEPGPWLTSEEFFRPFEGPDPLLSHDWHLLGRESEADDLVAALARPGVRVVLLAAAGGMGKSRLLKEVARILAQREPSTCIRFLSSAADLFRGALDDLGPGPKVIVVDDAHDRDRLGMLFEYAADPSRQVRLALATRPYALDRIRHEAIRFNFTSPPTITLERLKRGQLLALAGQILSRFDIHDEDYARYVVGASGDSPLIVAMASRALAKDRIPVELAQNGGAFRDIVLSRFKEIAVHTAKTGEEKAHRDVLDMLALVQPFHPEDRQLLNALEDVQGVPGELASAVLDRFAKGGVTYRRGHEWRIMPDVLGDYLIETSCRNAVGRLSPFAERALDAVKSTLLKHALVNLGRLDWRLNDGDTADSALLSGIWRKFDDIDDEFDPRLEAIKSVAIYQPRQALEFVVRQARRKRKLRTFPAILRGIAQTSDYANEVMRLLWELGRDDSRELGPHPDHPIRVLSELGGYGGRKPLIYSEALLNLGLSLMDDVSSWKGRYTPLDVLKPLLSLEGTDDFSDGRTITFRPYFVKYDVVHPLRMAVIDKIVQLLRDPTIYIARMAGLMLQEATHYPHGLMGSIPPEGLRVSLTREFTATINYAQDAIAHGLDPIVVLAIARSISWHANHGTGQLSVLASSMIKNLPSDIEFRVISSLVDGWGRIFADRSTSQNWQSDLDRRLVDIAADFRTAKTDPCERLAFLESTSARLIAAGEAKLSSNMLMHKLLEDGAFARTLIEEDFLRATPLTRTYIGVALAQMMREDKVVGRAYIRRHISKDDLDMLIAAARAFVGVAIEDEDEELIESFLRSPEPQVVYQAIRAVWLWQGADDRRRVKFLLSANISANPWLIDELAMIFCDERGCLFDAILETEVVDLLRRISPIKKLDGYWIDEALAQLSYRFPFPTVEFFLNRVELAAQTESFDFRAANFGPYSHKALRFVETDVAVNVLNRVWHWLRQNRERDYYFHYAAMHMVEAIFLGSPRFLVDFFESKLESADEGELKFIGNIFREADHNFVFEYANFVIALLGRCSHFDSRILVEVCSDLYASAISGLRTSTPGEPSPQELAMRSRAESILARLSPLSPAYDLFDDIRKSALADIERAKRDAEAFDI